MENLMMLGLYVAIALVLVALFGGKRWFQRLTGERDLDEKMGRSVEQMQVDLLAGVGTGGAARQSLTRTIYRPSWGIRLVGPGLACLVLYQMLKMEAVGSISSAFSDDDVQVDLTQLLNAEPWMIAVMVLILWYSLFIWAYEIDIDGHDLSHIGWFFNRKTYDLRRLKSVSESQQGLYVLRFEDGRKTELIKYVKGAADLRRRLAAAASGQPAEARSPFL